MKQPGLQINAFRVLTVDGRNCALIDPVEFVRKDGTTSLVIPGGHSGGASSDGGSQPAFIWSVCPPFGRMWRGFFLHDAAYRNALQNADGSIANLSKPDCDSLLLEAMDSIGYNNPIEQAECYAIYEAVVRFGGPSFNQDRHIG